MPFTAGFDRVDYLRHEAPDGGRRWSERRHPTDALIHAVRDRRRPPVSSIYLDFNGAEQRVAWCGATMKIVLPTEFEENDPNACPRCLTIVRRPTR